ncbi:cytochrome c oxidase subunit II [Haloferax sp. MBLA0076]|uniref:Cytochrome c oxidase subunit II n=1 Tax=Haloferax litoreum TaxID=2666140 RepID=A0A6A8GIV8_9EURY|nr:MULTISPECIES: cytochrome c oxidase subunit II [Haloferax]KAB1194144.1 cytochrome c oxidase subunit II [Haloferax sp. CBA1148]MRX22701.1 cytochrome c oxidase subunit II [Haloferax litoreum]
MGTPLLLSHSVFLQSGLVPRGTRVIVFESIFEVFLVLGSLVGVVVIGYMLYNAYKYRSGSSYGSDDEADRPILGELPMGDSGGRKLATSFFMSMIIVVSLVSWTYLTLLYVEEGPADQESLDIQVEGYQFGWRFTYPNGHTTDGVLRVPADQPIELQVTSADVFHNFGITALRVKTDAIPGQQTETWFVADEPGTYTAQCFELCGAGHSYMSAEVIVMPPDEYEEWYESTGNETESASMEVPT